MLLQAAAALCSLQLLLAEGSPGFSEAHAGTAELLMSAAVQQLPAPLVAQLQLHCAALEALHLLRSGNTSGFFQASAGEEIGHAFRARHLLCMHDSRLLQLATLRPSAVPDGTTFRDARSGVQAETAATSTERQSATAHARAPAEATGDGKGRQTRCLAA